MRHLILLLMLLLPVSAHAASQDVEIVALLRRLATLLAPTPRTPQTYYVATTGADSHGCGAATNPATPLATFRAALPCLAAGDTLLVRGGTYAQRLDTNQQPTASGTSWDTPITIKAAPGEVVILKPGSSTNVMQVENVRYLIFDGLILDASNAHYSVSMANTASYVRWIRVEMRYGTGSGLSGMGLYGELIDSRIHHHGSDRLQHGIYACPLGGLIRGNEFDWNSGYGIQIYYGDGCSSGLVIENNRIHDNQGDGGMVVGSGDNIRIRNNLIYNNPKGGIRGICYGSPNTNIQVDHNTIVGNGGQGIDICAGVSGAQIRNNLLVGNPTGIRDQGSGTQFAGNLCSAAGPGCALVGEPRFVNAAAGDYHLQEGSLGLDAGVAVAAVTSDKDGVARPQGAAPDLGAYERVVAPVPPQPSGALLCTGELAAIPSTMTLRCVPETSAARRTP